VLNPEDALIDRERVLALREKRLEMMLALVEATQEQLERRLQQLSERETLELDALQAARFDRDKYLAEPGSSYLLLATGALEHRVHGRDLSAALLGALKQTSDVQAVEEDGAALDSAAHAAG
jgi:hypothetical protein